jgi:hypothetical protein
VRTRLTAWCSTLTQRIGHVNGEVGAGFSRLQGVGARRGKAGMVPGSGSGGAAWEDACESRI